VGLGAKLVRETLPLACTDYVELSAVMAKYNPFSEKAGMKRLAEQTPPKEAMKIVELLRELGFSEQLLGSERYVLEKLQSLAGQDVERIKQALVKHSHPRFMKAFSYHLPYGQKQAYKKEVEHLGFERLAGLIKICGFLMQTKAYLFWKVRITTFQ
jgi:hypothetical protein